MWLLYIFIGVSIATATIIFFDIRYQKKINDNLFKEKNGHHSTNKKEQNEKTIKLIQV